MKSRMIFKYLIAVNYLDSICSNKKMLLSILIKYGFLEPPELRSMDLKKLE